MNQIQKIKKVMKDTGCSVVEACEALNVDCDASMLSSMANSGEEYSLAEIIDKGKLRAAQVLVDIIDDPSAENKDRIAAAKIVLIGSGELPQLGANAYEDRFKKFDEIRRRYELGAANVIEVTDSVNHHNRIAAMAS
jgi:hypothetical protein